MSDSSNLHPDDFFFLSQMDSKGESVDSDSFNLDEVEKTTIRKAITKHSVTGACLEPVKKA